MDVVKKCGTLAVILPAKIVRTCWKEREIVLKQGFLSYLKCILAVIYLEALIILKAKRRSYDYDLDSVTDVRKHNIIHSQEEWNSERPQSDDHLQKGVDEVFVYGINNSGQMLLLSFQRHPGKVAEVVLVLKTPDGKQYVLPESLCYDTSDAENFSGNGFRIDCVAPMRRLRIVFNGMLRESSGSAEDLIHVNLRFIWVTLSSVLDYSQVLPVSAIVEQACRFNSVAAGINFLRNSLAENSYEQAGFLEGICTIEGHEEIEMNLWGSKSRTLSDWNVVSKKEEHFYGVTKGSLIFHIREDTESRELQRKRPARGFVLSKLFEPDPLNKACIVQSSKDSTAVFLNIDTDSEIHKIQVAYGDMCWQKKTDCDGQTEMEIRLTSLTSGNETGNGLRVHLKRGRPQQPPFIRNITAVLSVTVQELPQRLLFVKLDDARCRNSLLTGGKGSSLAFLTAISKITNTFYVPKGVVMTTDAYKLFEQNVVKKCCQNLTNIACGLEEGNLKETCDRTVSSLSACPFPEELREDLKKALEDEFGSGDVQVAVRSSAIGEDSGEMSAAGQMDTFLGVRGFDKIAASIVKCWASQFSYVAVQYKREYGQPINSPMAVVIQEMVPADKAGVMFTCDPLSGNPSKIVINSNFGLGESVVSSAAEPDTLTLRRTSMQSSISLESVQIGSKKVKVTTGKEGTVTEVNSTDASISSLKEDEAVSLAKLGCQVENYFGNSRDIEWAICGENIYLLQARPVTSVLKETDFEVVHRNDLGVRSEVDAFSTANVGEVLPGALSYLGNAFFILQENLCGNFLCRRGLTFKPNPYSENPYLRHNQHSFFGLCNGYFGLSDDCSVMQKSLTFAVIGKDYKDEEAAELSRKRLSIPGLPVRLQSSILSVIDPILSAFEFNRVSAKYRGHKIDLSTCDTSLEMLLKIGDEILSVVKECTEPFYRSSLLSSAYNMTLVLTLADTKGDVAPEVFADFSRMVRGCTDVESADVPQSTKALAQTIGKSDMKDRFPEMTVEEALEWLTNAEDQSGREYKLFMEKHGHRCIKECDAHSLPWQEDPKPFIKSLQALVRTQLNAPTQQEAENKFSLDDLQIKLSTKKRFWMKIYMPLARKAVAWRENCKSVLIKGVHVYRTAVRQLATKMVEEGRLPDKELVFFLTFDELYRLIETRSPELVARAKHRQRLHPKINALRYPFIFKGVPKPIDVNNVTYSSSTEVLTGTPVSQGSVKGRARVVKDLEEAYSIQRGEILVTFATDTGWTPYFPLLSGVITEIGGLMSHGAVVAREYGLPCVVGLESAPLIFKTGDLIYLDGSKGTVQKIEPQENETI